MRFILLLPATAFVSALLASAPVDLSHYSRGSNSHTVVVDSIDDSPIPQISVFNKNGVLIGFGSDTGRLPYISAEDYPVSVRCLGYRSARVVSSAVDTLRLCADAFELPEVSVATDDNTVLYMKGVVREYSTFSAYSDTIFMFREKEVDFMIPSSRAKRVKGWNNPRILKCDSYYRFSNGEGKDSVSNYYRQNFSWGDWISLRRNVAIPIALQDSEQIVDTVKSKSGKTSAIWRRSGDNIRAEINVLADTANYVWISRLASFHRNQNSTLDFTNFRLTYNYIDAGGGSLWADNIASIGIDIESYGRGRELFRIAHKDVPYYINTHAEVYILDREYITEKQAKIISKKIENAEFVLNDLYDAIPLVSPDISNLIARVEGINHTETRVENSKNLDRLLSIDGKIVKPKDGPFHSLVNAVKSFFKTRF